MQEDFDLGIEPHKKKKKPWSSVVGDLGLSFLGAGHPDNCPPGQEPTAPVAAEPEAPIEEDYDAKQIIEMISALKGQDENL